jgi:hypothetical protein
MIIHKLNSTKDLDALKEEYGEVTDGEKNFVAMYRKATSKKFGFLFITTGASPRFSAVSAPNSECGKKATTNNLSYNKWCKTQTKNGRAIEPPSKDGKRRTGSII